MTTFTGSSTADARRDALHSWRARPAGRAGRAGRDPSRWAGTAGADTR